MDRLTIEKARQILVTDLSGGYQSPCFGCESLGNCTSKKIQPCAIYRALEKLKEYEDLEEQGKLLKLPCAVGDTVYQIMITGIDSVKRKLTYEVFKAEVFKFSLDSYALCFWAETEKKQQSELPLSAFGETVFLTREEAETALQEMKGETYDQINN